MGTGTYKNIVILFYADSKNLNLPKIHPKTFEPKNNKKILFQVFVFCVYCVTKKLPFKTYVF